jgi:hypothetical protein
MDPSDPDAAAGDDTDAGVVASDAGDPGADAAPSIENIADFTDCQVPAPGTQPWHINEPNANPAFNLFRTTVDTADHPEALCNDGTAAVYYVRRGAMGQDDMWQIHLQGGGGCSSYQGCLDRWCSAGTNYDATKMSTAWAPESMAGQGLMTANDSSAFDDWNHVFVYYCSSDGWKGQASDAVVDDGVNAPYSADFNGHDILAAVIDELDDGATSDGSDQVMPSLADATAVLFSGTSAGSNGAKTNADWLGERLRSTNADVQYRAIFDAAIKPDDSDYMAPADYAALRNHLGAWGQVIDSFVDESCLEQHTPPATPTDESTECNNLVHVMRNHITTPYFARMDLRDSNALPWENPVTQTSLGTNQEFAQAVEALLADLPSIADPAGSEEWDSMTHAPGVFGPQCTTHTALVTNRFFTQSVQAGNGMLNFHDLLLNWLAGSDPQVGIDSATDPGTSCSPPM